MTTPATRTPIRIARGTYTNLNASIADILDGEICWATDEDKVYVKDGGSLVATMLTSSDIGSTVQAYDATILKSADIGTSVQAYDATILKSADIGTSVQAYDADTAKLDVVQTFTAQQTFGEIVEGSVSYGTVTGSTALDPANGSLQRFNLVGNTTFTDSLVNGQSIVVQIDGGASYTVTWPTITWVTSGGNVAPTLTANDTLVVWKNTSTLFGAYVGSYV
jgi:hypothetical protein